MASAPQAFHKKEDFTTQIHLAQSYLDSYFKACDELHSDANLYSNNTWASTPPAEINELEDLKLTKTEVEQHAVRLVQTEPSGSWLGSLQTKRSVGSTQNSSTKGDRHDPGKRPLA